jgi:tryptophan-rich sensory protein
MAPDEGRVVQARPPRIAFALVWPVLYLLLGSAWYSETTAGASWAVHAAVVALLASFAVWQVLFSRQFQSRRAAVLVLVLALALCITCQTVFRAPWNRAKLASLVAWLVFALIMSVIQLQVQPQRQQAD